MKETLYIHLLIISYFAHMAWASVAWCPNRCSGNGVCNSNTRGVCDCYPGFIGVDCSQRICPSDIAWVDFPTRNNTAHAPFTECSNMGTCDRSTGLCKCRPGFSGPACERIDCPMGQTPYSKKNFFFENKECSGNGRCVSLRELSTYEDFTTYFNNEEYDGWDADKIYGCLCDEGWEGPRCDLRSCAKGVDPDIRKNNDPIYETQFLECKCDVCQGGFNLILDNQVTAYIPYDGTAPLVKQELESFEGIKKVDVDIIQGDALCSRVGSVVRIQFMVPRGPQSRMKVLLAQGLRGRFIRITAKGENAKLLTTTIPSQASGDLLQTCSNRGLCDTNTGTCMCQAGYRSSDGMGNFGAIDDCGYQEREVNPYFVEVSGTITTVSSACPLNRNGVACSGHGHCYAEQSRCQCDEGYQGYDCSELQCPVDYSWFGLVGQDHKGLIEECSGVGTCNRQTGTCECVHSAYGGIACEQLTCATDESTGLVCGGHGVCLPMWHLALYAYNPAKELARIRYDDNWDAGKVHGCLCERAISVNGQYDATYLTLRPFTEQTAFFNRSIGSNNTRYTNVDLISSALLTSDDIAKFHRPPYAFASTDYFGYVCTEKRCPTGDVPTLYDHSADSLLHLNEIQQLICRANNGSFTLTFRENTTLPIFFNATTSELEYRLEQIFTIGDVKVTIEGTDDDPPVCSSDRDTSVLVEFLTEHGDLPMLRSDVSRLDMNGEHVFGGVYTGNFLLNITEYQRGTTKEVECSGTGICDYQLGQCRCMEGFFSSNGSIYAPGESGDCSYFNEFYTIETLVHDTNGRKKRHGLDTNA